MSTLNATHVYLTPTPQIGGGFNVAMVIETPADWACVQPLNNPLLHHFPKGGLLPVPPTAFNMDRVTAQAFMDALWQAGLRPARFEGGDGMAVALAAKDENLRDLRHILERFLPARPPQKSNDTPESEPKGPQW